MNAENSERKESAAGSGKMLQVMVSIGLICALMIVVTFEGTAPIIKQKRAAALEKAIFRVLPGMETKKTFHLDQSKKFVELKGEGAGEQLFYAGYDKNGELVGLVMEASGMGFADVIRILYGYDPVKQAVVGFYVLETKETPGLGDKIEKDTAFLGNFRALDATLADDRSSVRNPIVTVKHGTKKNAWEVDAITGATISSRAIGNILGESTKQWVPLIHENQEAFKGQTKENEKR